MEKKLMGGTPGKKNIKRLLLITAAAVFSAVSSIYGLRLPGGSTTCAVMTLLYLFVYTRKLPPTTKYRKTGIAVFSALFSVACIQGALLRITGELYTGLVKENFFGYFRFRDAVAIVILAICTYYLIRLSIPPIQRLNHILQLRRQPDSVSPGTARNGQPQKKKKASKRSGALFSRKWKAESTANTRGFLSRHRSLLMPMACLFLCWLPYFISYYPGFILGDSCSSIRQALGLEDYSNHYPVMYTLFIKLCLNIGDLFGSLTFGCAIYSLFQMLFLSYALARTIQWLGRRGVPWQICVLLTLFFGLTPFFAQISIAMWKDPVFSAAILLWTLLLVDHISPPGLSEKEKRAHVFHIDWIFFLKTTLLLLLICMTRNNGIYITIFCVIVFFLLWLSAGKKRRRLSGLREAVAGGLLAMILCSMITGPIYESAGVKPTENIERVGIMMNQMARTVALSGNLSEEDKEFMNHLMPLKEYKKKYRPCVVDLLKWDDDFNDEYLNKHMSEFFRTWISIGLKNPRNYLQGWELLTFGYWMPNQWNLFWDGANIIKGNLNDLPFDDQLNDKIQTVYGGKGHHLKAGPRLLFDCKGTIAGLGTVSWIMLFALLITIIRKEWSAMAALMPSVGLFITLLLASPYYYWQRYGLAEYYLLPVYIFIIICYSGRIRKPKTG